MTGPRVMAVAPRIILAFTLVLASRSMAVAAPIAYTERGRVARGGECACAAGYDRRHGRLCGDAHWPSRCRHDRPRSVQCHGGWDRRPERSLWALLWLIRRENSRETSTT